MRTTLRFAAAALIVLGTSAAALAQSASPQPAPIATPIIPPAAQGMGTSGSSSNANETAKSSGDVAGPSAITGKHPSGPIGSSGQSNER
jgi:hypothetical protein